MAYDLSDGINVLELAKNGERPVKDFSFSAATMSEYIAYIKELVKIDKPADYAKYAYTASYQKEVLKNESFFAAFKSKMRAVKAYASLDLDEMLQLVSKIENETNDYTSKEFDFMSSSNVETLEEFIATLQLPTLKKVSHREAKKEEHASLLECFVGAEKDEQMEQSIVNAWEVNQATDRAGFKKITLVHGTKNLALLNILNSGFKILSNEEAADAGTSISGRMLGDGIYFARPDQISKTQFYQGRESTQGWIIVADVFYKSIKKSGYASASAIRLEEKAGIYGRDEYAALPSQINIRYILETKKKLV